MDINWQYKVDEVEAVFDPTPDWDSELMQLDAGLLGYGRCDFEYPGVTIHYETVAKPIRSLQQLRKKGFFAGVVLAGSKPILWKGHEVDRDFALVFGETEHDMVLAAGSVFLTIEVDWSLALASGAAGLEAGLWQCDPIRLGRFVELCDAHSKRRAATHPCQSIAPDVAMQILYSFLSMLARPLQKQPSRQFGIISKAEEFAARQGWCEGVAIDNLADAIDVSRRTLHRSFKELYGMGPQGYLRLVRLHMFREALMTGDHTGIADAALGAGFQHFGRAAQYYRQQFGELPKQTLKRALES